MNIRSLYNRIRYRLSGRVVRLYPAGAPKGRVLLSYVITPFMQPEARGHSNYWESEEIAAAFLERGYEVDVIDLRNREFTPRRAYDIFIDNGTNMDRLAPLLPEKCIKVFHITESHWKFNNEQEHKRLEDLAARRGITLPPERIARENHAIETCDLATILEGSGSTRETYAYAGKTIYPLPLPGEHEYEPLPRDVRAARRHFVWFGGTGAVHKGLDVVLEAFARMPDYRLTVFGKVLKETAFVEAYRKELLNTPNIEVREFIDPASQEFQELAASALGMLLPSCAEGCAGSVILAMHAGLIPIVSRQAGVEVEDYGILLPEISAEAVQHAVGALVAEDDARLSEHSRKARDHARRHYTRAEYAKRYRAFIDILEAHE